MHRTKLQAAKKQESRIRFHSEATVDEHNTSPYLQTLLSRLKDRLIEDKYQMFKSLVGFPIDTVSLSDRIYTALKKLFDGRNPVYRYEFSNPDLLMDWNKYRTGKLNFPKFWETIGFEQMKCAINSIVIVDVARELGSDLADPYMYFLSLDRVIDFKMNSESGFEWIIFDNANNEVAVFDDEQFRIFERLDSKNEIKETAIVEVNHELSYCPARFFWETSISNKNITVKRSPLSNELDHLDKLWYYLIANEYLNQFSRFPITSVFGGDCDYTNESTGEYCDGGLVRHENGDLLHVGEKPKHCPVCSDNRFIGPGSVIEIDPPGKANDNADLRNPIQVLGIEIEALKYNNDDVKERALSIYQAVTGFQGMLDNNQAINESQVLAILQSLEGALVMPQQNFESIMVWTEETIAKLRYGVGSVNSFSISLGTEHYILTTAQILDLYQKSKTASFSVSILDMLENLYYETEYRNNPEQLQRHIIICNLDPFRHRTVDEVEKMYSANSIKFEDYIIKLNLSSFLARFERENISLNQFASGLSFDEKIKKIRAEFVKYAAELKPDSNGNDEKLDLKQVLDAYGVGVRAGTITPQIEDENSFRTNLGLPLLGESAKTAWKDDEGVRRPITLKSKEQADLEIEKLENQV